MYIKKNWLSVCQSVRFSILQTVTTHSMVTLQEDVEGAGLVVTDPHTEQVKKKRIQDIISELGNTIICCTKPRGFL